MLLVIDNYDSFVFNLARYFERLGQSTHVVRNDAIDAAQIAALAPQAIIVSPGPCTPQQAGCSLDVIRALAGRIPILGICLGHQAIGEAFGARIVRADTPLHGRTSPVFHQGQSVFAGLPNPLVVGRYHSLVVAPETLGDELLVTARTADSTIMGLAHRELPIVGLQFHPESILTECGYEMLHAFLRLAGIPTPAALPAMTSERVEPPVLERWLPTVPVTF